ncbi:MAG TPA: hypothetical protein VM012_15605 [Flavitalea sp.]|nr:hypothetical protein [Flavitalea sp.]
MEVAEGKKIQKKYIILFIVGLIILIHAISRIVGTVYPLYKDPNLYLAIYGAILTGGAAWQVYRHKAVIKAD